MRKQSIKTKFFVMILVIALTNILYILPSNAKTYNHSFLESKISKDEVKVGDTFTMVVAIPNRVPSSQGIKNGYIEITYDTNILECTKYYETPYSNFGQITLNKEDNKIKYNYTGSANRGLSNGCTLFTLEFKVISKGDILLDLYYNLQEIAGGTAGYRTERDKVTIKINTVIELESIDLNKTNIEMVEGTQETLNVTYSPEDTTENKNIVWTSSNEEIATVDGKGTITAIKEGTVTITADCNGKTATCTVNVSAKIVLGDVNLDGKVNARDAKLVLQYFNGQITFTADQKARADVNGDGKINARDAKLILQIFNGQ